MIVDVEDYRKRARRGWRSALGSSPSGSLETGSEEELEPMNSYERKLVHDAAATSTASRPCPEAKSRAATS